MSCMNNLFFATGSRPNERTVPQFDNLLQQLKDQKIMINCLELTLRNFVKDFNGKLFSRRVLSILHY